MFHIYYGTNFTLIKEYFVLNKHEENVFSGRKIKDVTPSSPHLDGFVHFFYYPQVLFMFIYNHVTNIFYQMYMIHTILSHVKFIFIL